METAQSNGAPSGASGPSRSRRLPMALLTWAFVMLVLLIVAVLLVVKITRGSTTLPPPPVIPAPTAVVAAVSSVPGAVFDVAGSPDPQDPAPTRLSGQPALEIDRHPAVVFVGAEFCPYCAAERWALVAALGRFGTFSGLGATSSTKYEVFPGTQTFSFEGARFHSRYLSFVAVEEFGQEPSTTAPAGFPELESLPPLEQNLVRKYGVPSGPGSAGQILLPFVDVANRLVVNGAAIGFSPALLEGQSMSKIAGELLDATNPVSRAVLGEANILTAAICSSLAHAPRDICNSAGVSAAAATLGVSASS